MGETKATIEIPPEKRDEEGVACATRCTLAPQYERCLVYFNGKDPAVKTDKGSWVCLRHAMREGLITRDEALEWARNN